MPARKLVLIIDDDRDIREAIGDLLGIEGYQTAEARDGGSGMTYLRSHPAPGVITCSSWNMAPLWRRGTSCRSSRATRASRASPSGCSHPTTEPNRRRVSRGSPPSLMPEARRRGASAGAREPLLRLSAARVHHFAVATCRAQKPAGGEARSPASLHDGWRRTRCKVYKSPPPCTTRRPPSTAGKPMPRYEITNRTERTPARSAAAVRGQEPMLVTPWKPVPKPAPASVAPVKNSGAIACAAAATRIEPPPPPTAPTCPTRGGAEVHHPRGRPATEQQHRDGAAAREHEQREAPDDERRRAEHATDERGTE